MTLKVIGAGLPRTGTLSMKAALEALGFGRCYHMEEIFHEPSRAEPWARFFGGGEVDWDQVFEGYGAGVDAPICFAWRAVVDHYPEAKVVLTTRDAEAWYASMMKTIFAEGFIDSLMGTPIGAMVANMQQAMMPAAGGPPPASQPPGPPPPGGPPREAVMAMREAHNAAVLAGVAPERLLVFDVKEGWAPLCRFLGVEAPSIPFPRVNEAEGFHERFAAPNAS
jgi:hypothetical protein